LGSTDKYEKYLSSLFPDIQFTVATKADSKFKIVGAASIAAKVTRDACIEGWVWEEVDCEADKAVWTTPVGSGYPSGMHFIHNILSSCD
jgi:ribonuclease H2 subunit A